MKLQSTMFEKVSFDQFYRDLQTQVGLSMIDENLFMLNNKESLSQLFDKENRDPEVLYKVITFDDLVRLLYDEIQLPKRATNGSAGYDFYAPYALNLRADKSVVIATGIKCKIDQDWVLQMYPRSGYGFKYGIHLANTVGIIDSDYYNNETNEGHIMIKLVHDSSVSDKTFSIAAHDAICQGIFLQYGTTCNDFADTQRTGGFGSTSK